MRITGVLILLSSLSLSLPHYCMSQSICDIANCIHGVCVLDNRQNEGFRCDCNIGFTGAFCERLCTPRDLGCEVLTPPPPMCNPQTCLNGQCNDSSRSIQCICYPGWTGEYCDVDIDNCRNKDSARSVFGPCSDYGSIACVDGNGTYRCECVIGFTGRDCEEDIDECDVPFNRCSGHGVCINQYFGYYSCLCDIGFTGHYCHASIPQCASSPCQNQATCEEQANREFRCICPTGYSGVLCDLAVSGTVCDSEQCMNGGTCYETSMNNFTCQCQTGYFGSRCSLQNCTEDFCKNGGLCRLGEHVPVCECSPRYEGSQCEIDRCENVTCLNGGTCEVSIQSLQPICQCQNNYTGFSCEIDNSCPNQTCAHGEFCSSIDGQCMCPNRMACIKEVNASMNLVCDLRMPCLNGGTCVDDGEGNFSCLCSNGFYGRTCLFNICTMSTCRNGGTCFEGILGSHCICTPQYRGENCDVNKCENLTCLNGGTCRTTVPSLQPFCLCQNNYTGLSCEIDNSCSNQTCTNGEFCSSMNGQCLCPSGMACIKESNSIIDFVCDRMMPCSNGSTCIDNGRSNFTCLCMDGFYGKTCSFQNCTSSKCMNGGTCQEGSLGSYCVCSSQYDGENCEMDKCENMTCLNGGSCVAENKTLETYCLCNELFYGERCELDACVNLKCQSGEVCSNTNNMCKCSDGRPCSTTNTTVSECTPNLCLNEGTCISSNHSIFCFCVKNFSGQYCQDERCSENACEKDCSCVEVTGEAGIVPVCRCALTTAPLRKKKT